MRRLLAGVAACMGVLALAAGPASAGPGQSSGGNNGHNCNGDSTSYLAGDSTSYLGGS